MKVIDVYYMSKWSLILLNPKIVVSFHQVTFTWHKMAVSDAMSEDNVRHGISANIGVKVWWRCLHTFIMVSKFQHPDRGSTSSGSVGAVQNSSSGQALVLGMGKSRLMELRSDITAMMSQCIGFSLPTHPWAYPATEATNSSLLCWSAGFWRSVF